MCPPSELSDGYEPHDHIHSAVPTRTLAVVHWYRGGGCTRGGAVGGWLEGAIPGTTHQPAEAQIEAYLRNIQKYSVHTAV